MTKQIYTVAKGDMAKENNLYYMEARDRVEDELVGVFRYPYKWLAAHQGNAVVFKLITKAQYETYVEFGIPELTLPEISKLGAYVDDDYRD